MKFYVFIWFEFVCIHDCYLYQKFKIKREYNNVVKGYFELNIKTEYIFKKNTDFMIQLTLISVNVICNSPVNPIYLLFTLDP